MYSRSLQRSLALAAGVTVSGEFAARVHRQQQQQQEESDHPYHLQHHVLLHLPSSTASSLSNTASAPSLASFFLSSPSPAFCSATAIPEYHQVPLPPTDASDTQAVISRMRKYLAAPSLDDVGKFKKEKAGVKIYTVKEGSIPDPGEGGTKTGLPVARIGEAVIKAPLDQVATLWWVFNGRILWDKANTLASEVVEEYGKNCRLVYIKGAPKPMISSRDFVFVSHKIPASDVGGRVGSQAFLQTNAATALPENSGAVRGNINSVVLLDSLDAYTTRVRYVCEIGPNGWLPNLAVEAAADDLPGVLGVMKAHLESAAASA